MGMFEHFPYTNFHDLNLDWLLKTMKSIKDSLDDLWKQFLESRVPRGGDPNQVLTKTTANDFAMAWKDVPHELPEGGAVGQMLSKKSDSNYDVQWSDAPESLPEGGAQGQVLAKKSAENFDVEWVDQSGDTSKYLPLAGGTMDAGAVINSNGTLTIQSDTLNLYNTKTHYDADINFTRPASNFYTKFFNGHMKSNNAPSSPEDFTNKEYVDNLAVPAGGTTGQVLAKKSDTDRDCEWVDQSGGASGDYLPLAGGTMNQDAAINFTESGSGHSELSSGELHHTGNPFQFVGDFNFQTDCPTTQGTPQTANDLTPKGYVDGVAIPAGGTTGQVLAKKSDTDRDCEWVDQSGGGSGDYLPLAGGTMLGKITSHGKNLVLGDFMVELVAESSNAAPGGLKIETIGPNPLEINMDGGYKSNIEIGDQTINLYDGYNYNKPTKVPQVKISPVYGVEYPTGQSIGRQVQITKDTQLVTKKYVDDAVAGASGGGSSNSNKTWFLSNTTITDGNTLTLAGLTDAWPKSGTACLEINYYIGGTGNAAIPAVAAVKSTDTSVTLPVQAYKSTGVVNAGFMTINKNGSASYTAADSTLNLGNVLFRLTTPDHIVG